MKGCYSKGGLAKRGQGIAVKGFAKGGAITSSGANTAGPSGKTMHEQVKKSVTGDVVNVRGVGAARARKATIY